MSSQQFSKEELESLKGAFKLYDRDGKGIEIGEFGKILENLQPFMSRMNAEKVAGLVDKNKNKRIEFDEFLEAMTRHISSEPSSFDNTSQVNRHAKKSLTLPPGIKFPPQQELKMCFDAFDTDKDGSISKAELKAALANLHFQLSEKEVDDMMEEADTNRDGVINFEEFKSLIPPEPKVEKK